MTEASGIQPTTNTASTIPTATEGSDVQLPTDVASSIASETEESGVQLYTDVASEIAPETEASTAQPSPNAASTIPTAAEANVVRPSTEAGSIDAVERIPEPLASSLDPRITQSSNELLMGWRRLPGLTAAGHILPGFMKADDLYNSVRCDRLASSTAAEGLTDDERAELAERLGHPSRVDRILTMTTPENTAHLMDYIHLADAAAVMENLVRALEDGPVKDAMSARINQYRSIGDDHQQADQELFVSQRQSGHSRGQLASSGLSQSQTRAPSVQRTGSVRLREDSPRSDSPRGKRSRIASSPETPEAVREG